MMLDDAAARANAPVDRSAPLSMPGGSERALAQAALLALDWGTSSLRAYVLDCAGQVLAWRQEPWGLMQVGEVSGKQGVAGYEALFERIIGDWPGLAADIPVITCGMVGSAQGWQEVPYLPVPSAAADLARQLAPIRHGNGRTIWAVPGWREAGLLPNVMRGEETQILGALLQWHALQGDAESGLPQVGPDAADVLLCLPGSHSKWARMQGDRIRHFDTFMTGEAFSAFSRHTILARTMTVGAAADAAAFERGLHTALAEDGKGVLANVFSCRTLGLSGELDAAQQADYLSGLLIGEEIASMRASFDCGIALVGDAALCRRYATAIRFAGVSHDVPILSGATERGLWRIAVEAGLIPETRSSTGIAPVASIT
ncbi:2-dehydro-3-deoxygalactonokinase [Robbsia andropogonis]|nr:2-dehydro-3-deoxygalactonokinase [Robbsia andropogonis]MCP1121055.1 2-dehydro-3-deoxygalactonokinase [Robbsia andropogonis]MCP1130848.1 2-dehydro-3-deoxygalactonokinase [Robbsia andropogonis]